MRTQIGETSRTTKGSRAAVITSLTLHVAAGILVAILLVMKTDVYQALEAMDIVWMDALEEPQQVKRRLKMKVERRLADPDTLMERARNPLTDIRERPDRLVIEDTQHNLEIEPLMTAADLDMSTDVTLVERTGSMLGVPGGKGQASGRTGPKPGPGRLRDGGGGGTGLFGGGGGGDPLDIIDFLRSRGDGGRIVYVLDVSASMGAAGLHKLGLAKESLVDHIYLLSEQDEFNIVTFSSQISRMQPKAIAASGENLGKAEAYLDRFSLGNIAGNLGTNTLGALTTAFGMAPDVVVLLTDGVPTSGQGTVVETDPDRIIRAARASNRTDAALFIVGLEIDNLGGPGELLLKQLAENTGGKVKFVGRSDLLLYKDKMASARPEPTLPN